MKSAIPMLLAESLKFRVDGGSEMCMFQLALHLLYLWQSLRLGRFHGLAKLYYDIEGEIGKRTAIPDARTAEEIARQGVDSHD